LSIDNKIRPVERTVPFIGTIACRGLNPAAKVGHGFMTRTIKSLANERHLLPLNAKIIIACFSSISLYQFCMKIDLKKGKMLFKTSRKFEDLMNCMLSGLKD
jgi:hypothetical protein